MKRTPRGPTGGIVNIHIINRIRENLFQLMHTLLYLCVLFLVCCGNCAYLGDDASRRGRWIAPVELNPVDLGDEGRAIVQILQLPPLELVVLHDSIQLRRYAIHCECCVGQSTVASLHFRSIGPMKRALNV